jgi:hypothetical protein
MATIPIFLGKSEEKESGGLIVKDSTAKHLFDLQQSYPQKMIYELVKDGKGVDGEPTYRLLIYFPEKLEELKNKKLEALQNNIDECETENKDSNFIDTLSLDD